MHEAFRRGIEVSSVHLADRTTSGNRRTESDVSWRLVSDIDDDDLIRELTRVQDQGVFRTVQLVGGRQFGGRFTLTPEEVARLLDVDSPASEGVTKWTFEAARELTRRGYLNAWAVAVQLAPNHWKTYKDARSASGEAGQRSGDLKWWPTDSPQVMRFHEVADALPELRAAAFLAPDELRRPVHWEKSAARDRLRNALTELVTLSTEMDQPALASAFSEELAPLLTEGYEVDLTGSKLVFVDEETGEQHDVPSPFPWRRAR